MKILVVAPNQHPQRCDIPHTLEAMQQVVGGYIQAIYPWPGDSVGLVCDEEGLFKDTEWNRYICPGVVIKGTFFICGLGQEDFTDLPDELIDKYEKLLWDIHYFFGTSQGAVVLTESGKRFRIR